MKKTYFAFCITVQCNILLQMRQESPLLLPRPPRRQFQHLRVFFFQQLCLEKGVRRERHTAIKVESEREIILISLNWKLHVIYAHVSFTRINHLAPFKYVSSGYCCGHMNLEWALNLFHRSMNGKITDPEVPLLRRQKTKKRETSGYC